MRSQKYQNCKIKEREKKKREGVLQVEKENVLEQFFVDFFKNKCFSGSYSKFERFVFDR